MILHILKKDARRLWPAILLSLVVLASLAWHDRRRSDWMPGGIEQQLDLLVPAVWMCLIGLAVEQDPIAGDRQFWVTRPYRRDALLGAKLLFAALFVHLPLLLADCYILAGRGFSPAAYAGRLLARQLTLALALTLPAMALATLVRSFKSFLLEVIAVAAFVFLLFSARSGAAIGWSALDTVRWQSTEVLVGTASGVILAVGYFRRRVAVSRTVAVSAAFGASLLFVLFLPETALAVRVVLARPPAALSLRLDPRSNPPALVWGRQTTVVIPVALDGIPAGVRANLHPLQSEISGAGGRWSRGVTYPPPHGNWHVVEFGSPGPDVAAERALYLRFDPATFESLPSGPVTIRGTAAVALYRYGQAFSMATTDFHQRADGARCTTQLSEDIFGEQRIKVECESPGLDPRTMRVRALMPQTDRWWSAGRSFGLERPRPTLLSPVDRDQAFINVASDPRQSDSFYLPRTMVPTARIEITPIETLGYVSLNYELRDIHLTRFRVDPNGLKRPN